MWRAAVRLGQPVERLTSWRVPEVLQDSAGLIYAEPLFAHAVADPLGTALIEPAFDWLAMLPSDWKQREIQFTTLDQARSGAFPAFIKPADDKCFPAAVYASQATFVEVTNVVPGDTPVLMSEPVRWTLEFRCFVSERRCETMSIYLRNGELARDSDGHWVTGDAEISAATGFLQALLADAAVKIPPATVIDVGHIADVGWAVIEANAAWGSGIYGCDAEAVLRVIERACVPCSKVTEDDRYWIR